jgi:hypothetical protein
MNSNYFESFVMLEESFAMATRNYCGVKLQFVTKNERFSSSSFHLMCFVIKNSFLRWMRAAVEVRLQVAASNCQETV